MSTMYSHRLPRVDRQQVAGRLVERVERLLILYPFGDIVGDADDAIDGTVVRDRSEGRLENSVSEPSPRVDCHPIECVPHVGAGRG